jgi:hypothetical protein
MYTRDEEITNPLSGNDEDDMEQRKSALSHRSASSIHHREVCSILFFLLRSLLLCDNMHLSSF